MRQSGLMENSLCRQAAETVTIQAMPPFSLDHKVALITGSTRGIGKAIAEAMAEAGARVVISSRKAEACEQVAGELLGQGREAIAIPCNVSVREEVEALAEATLARWGRIDALVCNAAVNPYFGPLSGLSDEAFAKIMTANVLSNLWLCNQVIPQMAERGEGSVILISSIAALRGATVTGGYAISKAAEAQLARNLAVEWGPRNVRVNAIAPGLIKTDFARALWENPEIRKKRESQTPLRRIGEPDEVAGVAVFLASSAARFITGQTIVVDGGVTISS